MKETTSKKKNNTSTNIMTTANQFKDQGNEALKAEKFVEAIALYTKAIELDATNHVFYSNRSAAHVKNGDYDKALEDAKKTVELKSDWGKGHGRLGTALSYLSRYDEAVAAFKEGIKYDPNNTQLKASLEETESRMRSVNNPFNDPLLEQKLSQNPTTKDFLKDPSFQMILQMLKQDASNIGKFAQDKRVMQTLSVLLGIPLDYAQPPQPPPSQPKPTEKKEEKKEPEVKMDTNQRQAVAEKELGNKAYKAKDFATAHTHYDKAIELEPTNITFYTNKSAVLFEEARYDECVELCEKAVDIGRENRADYALIAKPIARIGHVHLKKKEYTEAISQLERSLSEHRNDSVVKEVAKIKKMMEEEQRNAYINPEIAEKEREEGNKFFKSGDYPTALKHYTEAIKRNPKEVRTYSNRAACYIKLAEFGIAMRDVDECLKLDPKFIKAYLRKGQILQLLKEPSKAKEAFEAALSIDPQCSEAQKGKYECQVSKSQLNPEERRKQAMEDPEVQAILGDPAMRMILEQMQENPSAAQDHMQNPAIRDKIIKLVDSGILQMR